MWLQFHRKKFFIEIDGILSHHEGKILSLIKRILVQSASGFFSSGKHSNNALHKYGVDFQKCYKYPFTSLTENDLKKAGKTTDDEKKKLRAKFKINNRFVVLSVGRFTYNQGYGKGFDTILKIAFNLKTLDIGFFIVGDEPTLEFLNKKQEYGLDNVHFVGFKTKDKLADYYKLSDVFILMTRGDVWGLVINEAMSHGLPIITSDKCVAGLELVDRSNGFIVDSENSQQASDIIRLLYNNQSLVDKLSESSLKKISNYTIESMAKRHLEIFNKIIDG